MAHRLLKIAAVVIGLVALLLVGATFAAEPLAAARTRRALAGLDGLHGTFRDVKVKLWSLSYEIHDLRIEKDGAGGKRLPYFSVASAKFGLYATELLHGHLVAALDLDDPKLTLISANRASERQGGKETPRIGERLERLAPFRLDRVQVKGGELTWVDAREPEKPALWLHGIEATLENFATRAALAKHEPTVLAARGTLQRTGKVSVFATADPLAKALTFAGQAAVEGLALKDLGSVMAAKSGVTSEKGTIAMYVRFIAKDGALTGGVRPVVQGADLQPGKPGVGPALKALIGDAALSIFKDDDTGKVATTIPIEGKVTGPQVQAVPTIMGILRNAFVKGLEGGMHGLPPPKADKPQGVLHQARRALSPGSGEPRAQPRGSDR